MQQVNQDSHDEIVLGPTVYLYDGPNLLEEVDQNANVLARYTQGPGIDQPLAELRSGTTSYYEQDGVDSVSSLSNSAGALANTYTYDSFGKLTVSTGSITNPFQYTGREFDLETGIYEYRARYYDSNTGRFLSEDPIGAQEGPNLYVYVKNNPINSVDPTGRYTIDKSCKNRCQLMGGGGPNNPAQPPTNQNLVQVIQQETDRRCSNLSGITDPKLRSCVQKSCERGKIKCKGNCEAGEGGYQRTILGFGSRTANLCTNNWPTFTPLSYVGGAVIHEWAHGCGWEHGQGGGIPYD
jgi:RHS repeat-associated protein